MIAAVSCAYLLVRRHAVRYGAGGSVCHHKLCVLGGEHQLTYPLDGEFEFAIVRVIVACGKKGGGVVWTNSTESDEAHGPRVERDREPTSFIDCAQCTRLWRVFWQQHFDSVCAKHVHPPLQ